MATAYFRFSRRSSLPPSPWVKRGKQSRPLDCPAAVVQSVSIVYARLHGVPLGRADRPLVGWYGDMDMQSHAWELLKAGPLDVLIRISDPIPLSDYGSRKELAEQTETAVREGVVRTLRGRSHGEPLAMVKQATGSVRVRRPHRESETWR